MFGVVNRLVSFELRVEYTWSRKIIIRIVIINDNNKNKSFDSARFVVVLPAKPSPSPY